MRRHAPRAEASPPGRSEGGAVPPGGAAGSAGRGPTDSASPPGRSEGGAVPPRGAAGSASGPGERPSGREAEDRAVARAEMAREGRRRDGTAVTESAAPRVVEPPTRTTPVRDDESAAPQPGRLDRLRAVWASPRLQRWRRWLPHAVALLLAVVVFAFLIVRARHIDWSAVLRALRGYPLPVLLGALLCASASHTCYAAYDLLARRYLGHRVAPLKVVAVGFVSYAFNLNLGAIVGGIGLRWRLYSRLGLDAAQTGRIYAFSLIANWAGYLLLSGLLLGAGRFALPPPLDLPPLLQRVLGLLLIALPLGYVTWCAGPRRQRTLSWRRYSVEFPAGRAAIAQVALSMCHWSLAAATIWMVLPLPYLTVLGTLLLAAVAGAMIHVPGGLGVIEAVFLATLRHRVPQGELVAALLAYRAAYYLLPLAGATVLHLLLEGHARQLRRDGTDASADDD